MAFNKDFFVRWFGQIKINNTLSHFALLRLDRILSDLLMKEDK
jgi:hypothetical protein